VRLSDLSDFLLNNLLGEQPFDKISQTPMTTSATMLRMKARGGGTENDHLTIVLTPAHALERERGRRKKEVSPFQTEAR
jgi:hypothetical protein